MSAPKSFEPGEEDFGPPPVYTISDFQTQFGSVSLHMEDRIRFVQFPPDDLAAIKTHLRQLWPRGIQLERTYSASYELKLGGRPWDGAGLVSDALPTLALMRGLLACLYSLGWIMTAATDISCKLHGKDTLLFRKQGVAPPPAVWMAVSFERENKLRLLGASKELQSSLSTLFKSMGELRAESLLSDTRAYYEFRLRCMPWLAERKETVRARLLILKMLEVLELHGWSLYASIDQLSGSITNSFSNQTDTWYCVKRRDWVPGSIVLHR